MVRVGGARAAAPRPTRAQVFEEELERRYYAPLLSCATLWCLLTWLFVLVFPIWLVAQTGAMWIGGNYYFEQPLVQYENASIVLLTGTSDAANAAVEYAWSTSASFNEDAGALFKPSSLGVGALLVTRRQVVSRDANGDGVTDSLEFLFSTPLPADFSVASFSLYPLLSVVLRGRARAFFYGVPFASWVAPMSSLALTVTADLSLRQKRPLPTWIYVREDSINSLFFRDLQLETLMVRYAGQNLTLAVQNPLATWTASPFAPGVVPVATTLSFTANVSYSIPETPISYIPSFLETLKFGFIQYFVLVLLLSYVILSTSVVEPTSHAKWE